jgi:hypothetical protein
MKKYWPLHISPVAGGVMILAAMMVGVVMIPAAMSAAMSNAADAHPGRSLVGAWYFQAPAPFAPHLATFHDDGTMEVMFPDAAEADRSASMGAGAWKRLSGNKFKGTFYEINATRATNQFESNLVVTFDVQVTGNTFTGTAVARYLDAAGNLLDGPFDGPLTGTRIEA